MSCENKAEDNSSAADRAIAGGVVHRIAHYIQKGLRHLKRTRHDDATPASSSAPARPSSPSSGATKTAAKVEIERIQEAVQLLQARMALTTDYEAAVDALRAGMEAWLASETNQADDEEEIGETIQSALQVFVAKAELGDENAKWMDFAVQHKALDAIVSLAVGNPEDDGARARIVKRARQETFRLVMDYVNDGGMGGERMRHDVEALVRLVISNAFESKDANRTVRQIIAVSKRRKVDAAYYTAVKSLANICRGNRPEHHCPTPTHLSIVQTSGYPSRYQKALDNALPRKNLIYEHMNSCYLMNGLRLKRWEGVCGGRGRCKKRNGRSWGNERRGSTIVFWDKAIKATKWDNRAKWMRDMKPTQNRPGLPLDKTLRCATI